MKKITAILLLTIVCTAAAIAGPFRRSTCGPGGCQVPNQASQQMQQQPIAATEWRTRPDRPTEVYLFRGGIQVGAWDAAAGYWRDYDAARDAWGPKTPNAPVAPLGSMRNVAGEDPALKQFVKVTRVMATADEDDEQPAVKDVAGDLAHPDNHGVDWSKIEDHQATYGGRKISCARALDLIGKQVPDDSAKFRLTVIGTPAEQSATLKEWQTVEAAVRNRCNTWAVTSDHWSLKDTVTGQTVFKTDGHPVIYLQAPDGKVLHRQDDGPGMIEAVRKAIKAYDSAKDPDLRKQAAPTPPAGSPTHPALPVCCLLGGGALFLYLKGKK